nr:recombinase family protein [Enterococcus cecorum]
MQKVTEKKRQKERDYMTIYGYARVSTIGQDLKAQEKRLKEYGATKIYAEKKSGKATKNREQLQALINVVKSDDVVAITKIDRLARSISDLQATIQEINAKGASVVFLDNGLQFDGKNDNPMSKLMLHMLGSFAEFERDLIVSRTKEGKQYAKENNKYFKDGRPARNLKKQPYKDILKLVAKGYTTSEIEEEKDTTKATIMRVKKQYREEYQKQEITLDDLVEFGIVNKKENDNTNK